VAKAEARETCKAETHVLAPDIVRQYLDEHPEIWVQVLRDNPGIIASGFEGPLNQALANITGSLADTIAKAMEGNGDEQTDNTGNDSGTPPSGPG
jgi:hypothetical protein